MKDKLYKATSDILLKNMQICDPKFVGKPVICVYDNHCKLASLLAQGYKNTLDKIENTQCIDFDSLSKDEIKQKLMSLPE